MNTSFQQQIYEFLMESQFFPPEQIRRQQLHQLEQLVRFTKREVPFYKTRLDCLFDRQGRFDFAGWSDVPILTRQDLIEHRESMLPTTLPPGHGDSADFLGSGTTGRPVTTRHNYLIGSASQAAVYRAFSWSRLDYSKNVFNWYNPNREEARDPHGILKAGWGPPWLKESTRGSLCTLNSVNPVEQALALVLQHKVTYVTGRANGLFDLAQEADRQQANIRIDCMYAFGTQITEASREECLRVFGAPIMSIYNSREVYDIAHQCPNSTNHHVNWELMLLEVLDDEDRPCPPGKQGRCVVTPFYNTAQPLIRYDLGDQVTLGENCSCGRTLQVISELNGRTFHMFRLPDGRKMSPRFHGFMRPLIGAHEWQFAQTALDTVEVRYLKIAEAPQSGFDEVTKIIRSQMTPDTKVVFNPVAKLQLTPAGKLIQSVCELPADSGNP